MEDTDAFGLGDLFLIAESVLGRTAEEIQREANLPLAESAIAAPNAAFGGQPFYPDPVERAAVLCSRIVRNHALLDGNKRVGLIAMRSEIKRLGLQWTAAGDLHVVDVILALAAGEMDEAEFIDWVQDHTDP